MDRIAARVWATLVEPALSNDMPQYESDGTSSIASRWKQFVAIGLTDAALADRSAPIVKKARATQAKFVLLHPSVLLALVGTTLNTLHGTSLTTNRHKKTLTKMWEEYTHSLQAIIVGIVADESFNEQYTICEMSKYDDVRRVDSMGGCVYIGLDPTPYTHRVTANLFRTVSPTTKWTIGARNTILTDIHGMRDVAVLTISDQIMQRIKETVAATSAELYRHVANHVRLRTRDDMSPETRYAQILMRASFVPRPASACESGCQDIESLVVPSCMYNKIKQLVQPERFPTDGPLNYRERLHMFSFLVEIEVDKDDATEKMEHMYTYGKKAIGSEAPEHKLEEIRQKYDKAPRYRTTCRGCPMGLIPVICARKNGVDLDPASDTAANMTPAIMTQLLTRRAKTKAKEKKRAAEEAASAAGTTETTS